MPDWRAVVGNPRGAQFLGGQRGDRLLTATRLSQNAETDPAPGNLPAIPMTAIAFAGAVNSVVASSNCPPNLSHLGDYIEEVLSEVEVVTLERPHGEIASVCSAHSDTLSSEARRSSGPRTRGSDTTASPPRRAYNPQSRCSSRAAEAGACP